MREHVFVSKHECRCPLVCAYAVAVAQVLWGIAGAAGAALLIALAVIAVKARMQWGRSTRLGPADAGPSKKPAGGHQRTTKGTNTECGVISASCVGLSMPFVHCLELVVVAVVVVVVASPVVAGVCLG